MEHISLKHILYTNTDFSLEVGVSERGVMVALAMTADEGLLALTVASIINRLLQLQIWDTAGQERFRSITQSYYRSANALILTYDITCEDSFRCLPEWLREIEQYANNQVVTILVGNKIDLVEKREVLRQRAEDFAEAQSMLYLETSAKESDNVEKLFLDLACELIREAKQNKLDNGDTAPMLGEGKTISYLNCCNVN
uniref:RAB30, member RAS oncogene family n=1 Tax=Oryzias latipes TaxID=8090 RepID=A0A3B3HMU5_ORYLA